MNAALAPVYEDADIFESEECRGRVVLSNCFSPTIINETFISIIVYIYADTYLQYFF